MVPDRLMNQALLEALLLLPADVTDAVHFFDAYGAFKTWIGDVGAFGFSNVLSPCAMNLKTSVEDVHLA